MAGLPKFLRHEPVGRESDEERQEEVEKGHDEQKAGEVSAAEGQRSRGVSQG